MHRLARLGGLAIAAAIVVVAQFASAETRPDASTEESGATPEPAWRLVEELADASYARRIAITRAIVAMDDRAVPALVRAKRSRSAATRVWAAETLESMGRERADEQIRTRTDATLAEIFHAYGDARDPDALGVLGSFLSSERGIPREAARGALLAYGHEANGMICRSYRELTGEAPPGSWSTEETARALFAASDRVRLRDVYALLARGLARAASGELAAGALDLDTVLARQPDIARQSDVARAYASYGLALQDADPDQARAYLEKARRLDVDANAPFAEAALAILEGRQLEARGFADEAPYRKALQLDPSSTRARFALDRLEARDTSRRATASRWAEALLGALLTILAGVLFLGGREPQRASPVRPERSSRPSA